MSEISESLVDTEEVRRMVRTGFRTVRRILRRVWRSRAVTVVLVLVLLGAVRALSVRQQIDTQRWGAVRTVVVAKFSFNAGHRLEANDLAARPLPIAAVPDQAIISESLVKGRTLRAAVTAGQVLTEVALGAEGARALLGSIGAERVAVAIATSGPRPPVQIGDHIDVHSLANAIDQPLGSLPSTEDKAAISDSHLPTDDLVVVALNDQSISVATPKSQVPSLIAVLSSGPVLIALHGR
jgi:hypothetical protein